MTITLSDAGGFCDGDAYQLADRSNTSFGVVTTPASWNPDERAVLERGNADPTGYTGTAYVAVAVNEWITHSFNVRFNDLTSDPLFHFATVQASDGNCWSLRVDSGDVKLADSVGTVIGTVATGIAIDTWYRVTVKFRPGDSEQIRVWWSLSGAYHPVTPSLMDSGRDLQNGSASPVRLLFSNGSSALYQIGVFFAAWTVRIDDGASIDVNNTRQTPMYQRQYRHDIVTATPNIGNALDTGTWNDADEIPTNETNIAIYNGLNVRDGVCTSDDATDGGPTGDTNASSRTWLRAYWIWRWRAESARFPATKADWYGNYGSSTAAGTDGTIQTTTTAGNGAWQTVVTRQWDDGAQFPASDEYMQQGFGTPGDENGGNVDVADMWCGLVIEYPPRRICIDGLVTERM